MKRLFTTAAVIAVLIVPASAKDLSNTQKLEAIENIGTIVAAMRKCDTMTVSASNLNLITTALKAFGVDLETTNTPTVTFMASQLAFETKYKEAPGMTCKLAMANFSKVLQYTK